MIPSEIAQKGMYLHQSTQQRDVSMQQSVEGS
jgi:hypothetical protein